MKKKRRKIRFKWKNIFVFIIFNICLVVVSISLINIISWKIDSTRTDKQIIKIQEEVVIQEVTDIENVDIIEEEEIPKFNPYWDYIQMDMISVDFTNLKELNKQVVGWIQVNGTNINYPFVQADNNEYYLNHSYDKSRNSAGWVFLDYRNNIGTNDKNMIIYAHGRTDKTMFGTLKNTLNNDWINNTNNHVVRISTGKENTLWQVFSVYRIPTTSDYIQIDFASDTEYKEFLDVLVKRSINDFGVELTSSNRILTLSTCYNKKEKVVLHAKLIKKEAR